MQMKRKNLLNNNGFTLVEILAVITILSLLMVFVIPNFISILNRNKSSAVDIQKNMIVSAARLYVEDCSNLNNDDISCNFSTTGDNTKINLEDLVNNGYIENVVVSDKTCSGIITITDEEYNVELNC